MEKIARGKKARGKKARGKRVRIPFVIAMVASIVIICTALLTGAVLLVQNFIDPDFKLIDRSQVSHGNESQDPGSDAEAGDPPENPENPDASNGTIDIPVIKSPVDFNDNGNDDYMDFVIGARKDVANNPRYDGSSYFQGGYPPKDVGVCTDVIWRAFKEAGYSLKEMVDRDIRNNPAAYPRITGDPDPNIDFRRVKNLDIFFQRHAVKLTNDKTKIEKWNAGDIVVYKQPDHIAIISDKRNEAGIPLIIHNAGRPQEADAINFSEIIGHYRFDASKLTQDQLIRF